MGENSHVQEHNRCWAAVGALSGAVACGQPADHSEGAVVINPSLPRNWGGGGVDSGALDPYSS